MNPAAGLRRWLKFNAVGAIGIGVQLAALAVLKGLLRLPYLTATALAVEAAVLHNFVWHERWTWKDRRQAGGHVFSRLVRFHLGNGLVSIAVNLVSMRLLVGRLHMQYLIANVLAIAAGSLANFFVADLLVFRRARAGEIVGQPLPPAKR